LYLDGRAWRTSVSRQPRLSLTPPEPLLTKSAYLRRDWTRNPIGTALDMRAALDALDVPSQRLVAAQFGVTRSRVAQYLGLLRLPERVVEFFMDSANADAVRHVSETSLRRIAGLRDPMVQWQEFERLLVTMVATG